MSYYAISALINAMTSLAFAGFVAVTSWRSQVSRRFVCFALSVGIWSAFYFLWQIERTSGAMALLWTRGLMGGAIWIPTFFLHFVYVFTGALQELKAKRILLVAYLATALYFIFDLGPWFITGVTPRTSFKFWPVPGFLFHLYLAQFIGTVVYAHMLLYRAIRQSPSAIFRNQSRYVFLGTLIGYAGGATNFPLWYGIPVPPFGNGLVAVYIVMVAYAIARYRLMDINVAVTRIGLFLAIYVPLLALPITVGKTLEWWLVGVAGRNWWVLPASLEALFAVGGLAVYRLVQRRTEETLLHDQRHYQTTLLNAAQGMTQLRELKRLLSLIVHMLTRSMKLTHAGIFLWDEGAERYVLRASRDHGAFGEGLHCAPEDVLVQWLRDERAPLVREEIAQIASTHRSGSASLARLEARLKMFEAAVVVPSFVEDRLLGFLVLGDKKTGQMYSPDDLQMLQTLANQAALAVENALFYELERERQAALFHSASMADLGTMASGLSHQINNRLYVMGMIADFQEETLEKLLAQDPQEPQLLRRIIEQTLEQWKSLKEEVKQGGEIVRDIRGLISTAGYAPLELLEGINRGLRAVRHKVKFEEFDLELDVPEGLPRLLGSAAQLGEVFFNLVDNGYDAIRAKRERLQPPPTYRGKLTIVGSTTQEPDRKTQRPTPWLLVAVSDTGIGVKPEDLRKLFIPFYTTKATSEKKGTGLGLYVIKKIIEAHGGTITVTSTYGVGTTFTIRLPVWEGSQDARRAA